MAQWRLYKTAHYNYRNTTRPYPLIPQVMNGTGALRQFVPRSLGIAPGRPLAIGQRQCLNNPRWRLTAEKALQLYGVQLEEAYRRALDFLSPCRCGLRNHQ
jgi:hypothetical protein